MIILGGLGMDLNNYINNRFENQVEKIQELWAGYDEFKIGVLLKEERIKAGFTQEQVACKIKTTKSVISRIENHADNITLSTLDKFARAIGKELSIVIK